VLHRPHVERHAEVGQFNVAGLRSQDIGRFEIAVDHVTLMQVVQAFENLDDIVGDEAFIELPEGFSSLE
jgi:hypothetical protein